MQRRRGRVAQSFLSIRTAFFFSCLSLVAAFTLFISNTSLQPTRNREPNTSNLNPQEVPIKDTIIVQSRPVNAQILSRKTSSVRGKKPRISVIADATKSDGNIRSFLDDVFRQSVRNELEVLLVMGDGVSEDFKTYHPSVRVLEFPESHGHFDLLNVAIRHFSRSHYVTVANLEDRKSSKALENYMEFLENNPEIDIVSSAHVKTATKGQNYDQVDVRDALWTNMQGNVEKNMLFATNEKGEVVGAKIILQPGAVWRRKIHEKVGYFNEEDFGVLSGWEFWLRCLDKGFKIHLLPKVLEVHFVDPAAALSSPQDSGRRAIIAQVAGRYTALLLHSSLQPHSRMNVLVVHEHVPFLEEGGDHRLLQVLQSLKQGGHRVTFAYRGWRGNAGHQARIQALVTDVVEEAELERVPGSKVRVDYKVLRNPAGFFKTRPPFDAAILATWLYKRWANESLAPSIPEDWIPLLRQYSPSACIATLSDDIHWVRNIESSYCHETEKGCNFKLQQAEEWIYRSADVLFTVSEADSRFLTEWIPLPVLGKAPTFLPYVGVPWGASQIPGWEARDLVLFVGSDHAVNVAAVNWFLDEVHPLLETLAGGADSLPTVAIVGRGWSNRNLSRRPYLYVSKGAVDSEELKSYLLRTRVFISPQVSGTGVSSKNLLALESGIPLVTTTYGRRGMSFDALDDPPASIEDNPKKFAQAIMSLFNKRELWEKRSKRGLEHVERYLSHHVQVRVLNEKLRGCRRDEAIQRV